MPFYIKIIALRLFRVLPYHVFWRNRVKRIWSTGITTCIVSNYKCHIRAFYQDRSIPSADRPQHVAIGRETNRQDMSSRHIILYRACYYYGFGPLRFLNILRLIYDKCWEKLFKF